MLSHFVRGLRLGGLLLMSLAAGSVVPAQAQVKLEHKFVDGRKTVTHTTMKIKQTLTLAGMVQETENERFAISTSQAGKRDADGKIRIEKKTDKLSVNLKIAGMEVTFDSDDPGKKAANPLLEPIVRVMRAASKLKPVLVHDKSGKVVAVEGLDKAADELPEVLIVSAIRQLHQLQYIRNIFRGTLFDHCIKLQIFLSREVWIKDRML